MNKTIMLMLLSFLNTSITPHYLHGAELIQLDPNTNSADTELQALPQEELRTLDPVLATPTEILELQVTVVNYLKDILRWGDPENINLWKEDAEFLAHYVQKDPPSWKKIEKIAIYLHGKLTGIPLASGNNLSNESSEFQLLVQGFERWISNQVKVDKSGPTNKDIQALQSKLERLKTSDHLPRFDFFRIPSQVYLVFTTVLFMVTATASASLIKTGCKNDQIINSSYNPDLRSSGECDKEIPLKCYPCLSASNPTQGSYRTQYIPQNDMIVLSAAVGTLFVLQFLPLLFEKSYQNAAKLNFKCMKSISIFWTNLQLKRANTHLRRQQLDLENGITPEALTSECAALQIECGLQNFDSIIRAYSNALENAHL